MQGIVNELQLSIESKNLPASPLCDKKAYSARFHKLVHREFLGILTAVNSAQVRKLLRETRCHI